MNTFSEDPQTFNGITSYLHYSLDTKTLSFGDSFTIHIKTRSVNSRLLYFTNFHSSIELLIHDGKLMLFVEINNITGYNNNEMMKY